MIGDWKGLEVHGGTFPFVWVNLLHNRLVPSRKSSTTCLYFRKLEIVEIFATGLMKWRVT